MSVFESLASVNVIAVKCVDDSAQVVKAATDKIVISKITTETTRHDKIKDTTRDITTSTETRNANKKPGNPIVPDNTNTIAFIGKPIIPPGFLGRGKIIPPCTTVGSEHLDLG